MPIGRLLTGNQFGADEIEILTRAFEQALRLLSLVDRDDSGSRGPAAELDCEKRLQRTIINIFEVMTRACPSAYSGDGDNRSMQLLRQVQTDGREVLGAAYG
jgi:hypothetical protein